MSDCEERIAQLESELAEMRRERNKLMRMLESLTPGGSEFHESPHRCVTWVKERARSQHRTIVRLVKEGNELRGNRSG